MGFKTWSFTSLHLSPSAKVAHRASTCAFHRFLSCAAVRTSLQDCHPAWDLSFSTVRHQVVFGRPLFLFPSGQNLEQSLKTNLLNQELKSNFANEGCDIIYAMFKLSKTFACKEIWPRSGAQTF